MNVIAFVGVVVVIGLVVSPLHVEGKRFSQKKLNKLLPENAQKLASWDRDVAGVEVEETAYSLQDDDSDMLMVVSPKTRKMKKEGFKPSFTLMDFSDQGMVTLLKARKVCMYLGNSSTTSQEMRDRLQSMEGTPQSASQTEEFRVTLLKKDDPMTSLLRARPAVSNFCGPKLIRGLEPVTQPLNTGDNADAPAKTLKITSLDRIFSITLPSRDEIKAAKKAARRQWKADKKDRKMKMKMDRKMNKKADRKAERKAARKEARKERRGQKKNSMRGGNQN